MGRHIGKGLVKTIPYYFTDPGAVASPSTDVHEVKRDS